MISTKTKLEKQWFGAQSVVEDSGLLSQSQLLQAGLRLPEAAGLGPVLVIDGKFPIAGHTWQPPKRSQWLDILESHDGLVIGTDMTGLLTVSATFQSMELLLDFVRRAQGNGVVIGRRQENIYTAAHLTAFADFN